MWPFHWTNTALSQMGPYTEFHILCTTIIEHDFISDFVVVVNSFIIFADIVLIKLCLIYLKY